VVAGNASNQLNNQTLLNNEVMFWTVANLPAVGETIEVSVDGSVPILQTSGDAVGDGSVITIAVSRERREQDGSDREYTDDLAA
jgi:hypothetical protein